MNTISLEGKTALVTGGATGIGKAISIALAGAGARIAVNHFGRAGEARHLVKEMAAAGASAIEVEADITKAARVEKMMTKVRDALGPIDILINNAGVLLEKPFLETTEEDWDFVVDTDLKGVFLCSRAALPGMMERGHGVIVNIASELGLLGRALYGPYCAAKAGVIGLTRSMAREFAPAIRVNAIAPGPINTPMLSLEHMSKEVLERERAIPAGRVGEPSEIAGTALFLSSDLASFYYGQVLSPNGGAWMG
ncbi:MAG TPA: 3-oxoacyl-ACP reductase family protein [Burkholderiales bacterium]|nr:3-oxoacyl-ACP reductase family protein [Burkholderiales bacterium]